MSKPVKSKITVIRKIGDNPEYNEPVKLDSFFGKTDWAFRGSIVRVEGHHHCSESELEVLIKHEVLKAERAFDRIRQEVEAFENLDRLPAASREQIPRSVRLFVWQRDGGKCVECGERERLEYDHLIPVIEGGSSTERNVRLLCERCNRQKGRML